MNGYMLSFFDSSTGDSICGFDVSSIPTYKVGDIIFLDKSDTTYDSVHTVRGKFKVKKVHHSFTKRVFLDKNSPIGIGTYNNCCIEVHVKRIKKFRFWLRPKTMINKNNFWLDLTRLKDHNIIEVMYFGMSYN